MPLLCNCPTTALWSFSVTLPMLKLALRLPVLLLLSALLVLPAPRVRPPPRLLPLLTWLSVAACRFSLPPALRLISPAFAPVLPICVPCRVMSAPLLSCTGPLPWMVATCAWLSWVSRRLLSNCTPAPRLMLLPFAPGAVPTVSEPLPRSVLLFLLWVLVAWLSASSPPVLRLTPAWPPSNWLPS